MSVVTLRLLVAVCSATPYSGVAHGERGRINMGLCRRRFLYLAAGAAALPAASRIARAQPYPSRPVKIIVGQAAGSASDLVARVIAQFLSEKLGQQFLVEVRPGAAGNIATEAVTHMPPAFNYPQFLLPRAHPTLYRSSGTIRAT